MSKNKKGVTLIELLVVISLGAILSSVAFFAYTGYTSDARDTKRKSDLNKVETVLQLYRNFK
jgi:prepilin-type N-terminal cleavage/methylation domain-containing protein